MTFRVKAGGFFVPIAVGDEFEWRQTSPSALWRCRVLDLKAGAHGLTRVYGLVLGVNGDDVLKQGFAKWFWSDFERVIPAIKQLPKGEE